MFSCIWRGKKTNNFNLKPFYGDVSIAVIVVFALVGDGVPFEIVDELIDLFPTLRKAGDFEWFAA